ncbi:MAG: phosphodiesterase [Hyphomicrobiales bacterium]
MWIAQISDTHVKAKNVRLFGEIDVYDHFAKLVACIEALDPKPDIVLHTGDITNDGEAADFEVAVECLSRLSMPVIITMGNHDRRETARAALGHLPGIPRQGRFAYSIEDYPVRIVMADTLVEGVSAGELGAGQLRWLNETLAAQPDKPTFVGLHHPPFDTGIGFMDRIGLRDRSELAAVISRHRQVKRVLAGHVHRPFTAAFGGTIAMTCPGAAHQVVADFTPDGSEKWNPDPPGFLLHHWTGTEVISIVLPVESAPPRPFSSDHTTIEQT